MQDDSSLKKKQTYWRSILRPYMKKSNAIAFFQIVTTLMPLLVVWTIYLKEAIRCPWIIPVCGLAAIALLIRCFVLMHDCGHGNLFKGRRLNKVFGYMLGVITGMPQYVWSRHHAYHHKTNGDWDRYQGPLNIVSTEKYDSFTGFQKKCYGLFRHPLTFPLAGFFYVLFNPRFNFIRDSIRFAAFVIKWTIRSKSTTFSEAVKLFNPISWKTSKEYRHQCYNNITLLLIYVLSSLYLNPLLFFPFYVLTLSLAGGIGILLFTVQHNYENSYASETANWDYYCGALEGTSYLVLPKILNWITADIAYHHVHHLSLAIPNYQLAKCHFDNEHLFEHVARISIKKIIPSFKYILWDVKQQKITSISAHKVRSSKLILSEINMS
ncbi:MAG: fatty acid desaturase [Coxiella sp. (in: Bacteria)]|nr:MAG: fatty acid desaturase [Coxiella sp. (in: g-proteobacteria)]